MSDKKKHAAIVAFPMLADVVKKAEDYFKSVYHAQTPLEVSELVEKAQSISATALMISMRHKITAEVIGQLPESVKIIATASVGFDHIDLKAAHKRGIYIANTPEVLTDATADLAFLLMLSAARRLPEAEQMMSQGWGKALGFHEMLGHDLRKKTLGIVGMGRIGQALADRARAFGMKIVYSNRNRLPSYLEKDAVYYANLKDMLPKIDVLSLNAPATPETFQVMNTETLALMKKGSILVNAGRGSLVNEDALIAALESKHLFAAGLDVFSNEPSVDGRFLKLPNVVLAPHIGSATIETRTAMGLRALDNMIAACEGKKPKDLLN